MMLQQAILGVGWKVHVVCFLQGFVVKHWAAVATKGFHALLQSLVGLDVCLRELKVSAGLGRKSDIFACPDRTHIGHLVEENMIGEKNSKANALSTDSFDR